MTTIALLLAALAAMPHSGPVDPVTDAVLAVMAPTRGHWEVEDAPAYFSPRTDIRGAPAPGTGGHTGGHAAEAREGAALVARRRP